MKKSLDEVFNLALSKANGPNVKRAEEVRQRLQEIEGELVSIPLDIRRELQGLVKGDNAHSGLLTQDGGDMDSYMAMENQLTILKREKDILINVQRELVRLQTNREKLGSAVKKMVELKSKLDTTAGKYRAKPFLYEADRDHVTSKLNSLDSMATVLLKDMSQRDFDIETMTKALRAYQLAARADFKDILQATDLKRQTVASSPVNSRNGAYI